MERPSVDLTLNLNFMLNLNFTVIPILTLTPTLTPAVGPASLPGFVTRLGGLSPPRGRTLPGPAGPRSRTDPEEGPLEVRWERPLHGQRPRPVGADHDHHFTTFSLVSPRTTVPMRPINLSAYGKVG